MQNDKEGKRLIKNYKGIDSYHVKYNEEAAYKYGDIVRGRSRLRDDVYRPDREGIQENTATRGRLGNEWTMPGNDGFEQGHGITEKNSEASKQNIDHGGKEELPEAFGFQQRNKSCTDSDGEVITTDTREQKSKGSCGSDFGGTNRKSEFVIQSSQEFAGNILLNSNTKVLNRQNTGENMLDDRQSKHGRIVRKLFENQDVQNENAERNDCCNEKNVTGYTVYSENTTLVRKDMEKDRERKSDIAEFEVDNLQAVSMEGRREGQIIGDQTSAQPEPVVMRSQSGVISPIIYQRNAQGTWTQSGYTTCMTHQV